jgi:adenosylmethionine-8-amino-7-oxononanoate aminotransferase
MNTLFKKYLSHIAPQYAAELWPPVIQKGKGIYLEDVEGRTYLDMDCGWGALGWGHAHPDIAGVTHTAVDTLEHAIPPTLSMVQLTEKLAALLKPHDLNKFFFGTSGSESVEHAILLALAHYPQKDTLCILDRAYHGSSISLLNVSFKVHPLARYSALKTVEIKSPYCFRCPFNKSRQTCGMECADHAEALLRENHEKIASLLIEPVLGRECIPLPQGYLKRVANTCKELGIGLTVDEIKTGTGRSGTIFAFEQEGVSPDIVCMGKSLSNGFPLSLAAFSGSVCPRDFLTNYILLQTTYSGHTMACARANKVLELLQKKDFLKNVRENSRYLLTQLDSLMEKNENVGEVRGKGMLFAIEFVRNKKEKKPSTTSLYQFLNAALENGIFFASVFQNTLVFAPPLVITREEMDNFLDRVEHINKTLFA